MPKLDILSEMMLQLVWWCAWLPMITGCLDHSPQCRYICIYNALMCGSLILASSFNNCPTLHYSSKSQLFSYHVMIVLRNIKLLTAALLLFLHHLCVYGAGTERNICLEHKLNCHRLLYNSSFTVSQNITL